MVAYPGGDRLDTPISPATICARAMQPGPLRLFFLGNLIPRKGLYTLLDALEGLGAGEWTLEVAGSLEVDRSYTRRILGKAKAAGLEGRISFLGPLLDERLVGCLLHAHLLVIPSTYEGFGIAYIEGMGFGLPAIASTSGAAHEIITTGENGYLISPGDARSLAAHLEHLARNRQRLAEMGLAARQRYLAHPAWEDSLGKIRDFLHEMADRRTVPGVDATPGERTRSSDTGRWIKT
jgi:glycosyltransferase involved in cell wall biosynthesis